VTKKEMVVDPVTLARCFGLYARVVTGATKYLRDESDTYSPMMDRLRKDKCGAENVINAFLACQRFLTLNQKLDSLFAYCDRILFMAVLQEEHAKLGVIEALPFVHDPRADPRSAAWFRAMASSAFHWAQDDARDLGTMFRELDAAARQFWDEGKAPPLGKVNFLPDLSYEEVDEETMAFFVASSETPKVVH